MTFLEAVYLFIQTFIHERPRAKSVKKSNRATSKHSATGQRFLHWFSFAFIMVFVISPYLTNSPRNYCWRQINRISTRSHLIMGQDDLPLLFLILLSSHSCFLICIQFCVSSARGHLYTAPSTTSADTGSTQPQEMHRNNC